MPIEYNFKYTLCKMVDEKEVIGYSEKHAMYNLMNSLHTFIYDTRGCITGWYKEQEHIAGMKVCYTCSVPYDEEESAELARYLEVLRENYSIYPLDEVNNVFMLEG